MPILLEKDNPPSKPFECPILEKEGTWWIAKVKPRQEKAFAFDLLELGIDYYLPVYEKKVKRTDGKLRKSTLVLFPSYVPFVSESPFDLLKNNRVATILPIQSQDRFRVQLAQFDLVSERDVHIEPFTCGINIGDCIAMSDGPLKGLYGYVDKKDYNSDVIYLNIDGLGVVKIATKNTACTVLSPSLTSIIYVMGHSTIDYIFDLCFLMHSVL
jgi:hypothetical protein